MTSLKVLSAAAVMALMLPLAAPTASFAQDKGSGMRGGGGGGAPAIGGGGGVRGGGGGGAAIGGGGPRGGGGGIAASPGPRFGGGGAVVSGGGPRFSGGGHRRGGHRYHHHRRFGGFGTGLVIGGALGSSYGYYGAPYGYGYYDDGYYDEPLVAVVPGGDDVEYCKRRFRSYDVRSRTYLGFDGLRHPCP